MLHPIATHFKAMCIFHVSLCRRHDTLIDCMIIIHPLQRDPRPRSSFTTHMYATCILRPANEITRNAHQPTLSRVSGT